MMQANNLIEVQQNLANFHLTENPKLKPQRPKFQEQVKIFIAFTSEYADNYTHTVERSASIINKISSLFLEIEKNKAYLPKEVSYICFERLKNKFLFLNYPHQIPEYVDSINCMLLKKWQSYGFAQTAFIMHHSICEKILSLRLHNHIQFWGHTVDIDSATQALIIKTSVNTIAIQVLITNLSIGQKNSFTHQDGSIYTYIQTGFIKTDPLHWKEMTPTALLTNEEYQYAMAAAQATQKKLGFTTANPKLLPTESADHILEIICPHKGISSNWFTSGINEFLRNPKHPYIRLITSQRELYCVGYVAKEDLEIRNLAEFKEGCFNSPDFSEALPYKNRYIVRFGISKNQFDTIKRYIEERQAPGVILYNALGHNCCTFIQYTMSEYIGINIPMNTDMKGIFFRLLPIALQNFAKNAIKRCSLLIQTWKVLTHELLPPLVHRIYNFVLEKAQAIIQNIALLFIGGAKKGIVGKQFHEPKMPMIQKRKDAVNFFKKQRIALINNFSSFFDHKIVQPVLPGLLFEWMQTLGTAAQKTAWGHGFHGQYR